MIRYQGSSSQELLNRIRRELGPNALIVSTEEGLGEVTVIAAIDRHLQPLCEQETFSEIKKCLIWHRTPRPVIDHLLNQTNLEGNVPEVLSRIFRGNLNVPSLNTILNDGSPLMFIGPPGVGKTLALIKVAAQCMMENRPVQVISTDRQKSGGCAQIESLCEALGVKVSVIENPMLLHRAIEENKSQNLLLIDTPATNPFDINDRTRLHKLVDSCKTTVVLVMPSRGDHEFCEEMESAFKGFLPQYMILSQLDLTQRLGHVLTRILDSQYPLIAVGQMAEVAHLLISTSSSAFTNLFIDRFDLHVQQDLLQPKLREAV